MKYILVALLFVACSPEKRIARILRNNPHLIKSDTLWVKDTIIRAQHTIDSVIITKPNDTIEIIKDKWKLRIIRDHDTLRIHDTAFADTIFKTRAIQVNTVSVKDVTFWDKFKEAIIILAAIILSIGLCKIFRIFV